MKIRYPKTEDGGRSALLKKRVSDRHGYSPFIDVLEVLLDHGWSESEIMDFFIAAGMEKIAEDGIDGIGRVSFASESITTRMRSMMEEMLNMQSLLLEVVQNASIGPISPETGGEYIQRAQRIVNAVDDTHLAGAGAYGSKVYEPEDDDDADDWLNS